MIEFEWHTDEWWLQRAYLAAANSKDSSTQNGAILTGLRDHHDEPVGATVGWNGFPDDVEVTPERLERPLKYWATEHAERNAIFEAAREGLSTVGTTMYCCWAACSDCARAIINCGVTKLVYHDPEIHYSRPDWQPDIDFATQMMKEAGVHLVPVKTFLDMPVLFNKQNVIV